MTSNEAMKWCRLYAEFALDPKVQSMSEPMQRRLCMLFCLQTAEMLSGIDDDELAATLRISPAELAKTKAVFLKKGFIHEDWQLANWEKRQCRSDNVTERTRKHKDKKKREREGNVPGTFPERCGNGAEQSRAEAEQNSAALRQQQDAGAPPPLPTDDDLLTIRPGRHEHDPADVAAFWAEIWRAFGREPLCLGWYERQRQHSLPAWKAAFAEAKRRDKPFASVSYVEKIAHDFDDDGRKKPSRNGLPNGQPSAFDPDPNADLNRDREAIMGRKWGSQDA